MSRNIKVTTLTETSARDELAPISGAGDCRPAALRQGGFGRPVGRRLRLLAALLKLTGNERIASSTAAEIEAEQTPMPRNVLTDWLFGARAASVAVKDSPPANDCPGYRLYLPSQRVTKSPALIYFHGGGWVSGDPGLTDGWCSEFSVRTGTVVMSVDYRLAPRHPFPAALLDGYAALNYLHANAARMDIDSNQVGVAGDSAGGNIAAALCLYARDLCGPAIASQTLICPALDLTLGSGSVQEKAHAPLLSTSAVAAYVRHYLGVSGNATDPYVSPLVSEHLNSLPPALIQVSEHDPLRDDGWRYAAGLRKSGIAVRITEYAGGPHGLTTFPGLTPLSRRALEEACAAHPLSNRLTSAY